MFLTNEQKELLQDRITLANGALKSLDGADIKALNYWYTSLVTDEKQLEKEKIQLYTVSRSKWDNEDYPEDIVKIVKGSKLGNCNEKAWMCAYHILKKSESCYLVSAVNWDHVYVILTTDQLTKGSSYTFADLDDKTCCVVDGWYADWHFPKLSTVENSIYVNIDTRATMGMLWCRYMVRNHGFTVLRVFQEI